jgi:pimeloyl-ACP methyl ester carboxylesterase
VPFAAVDGRRLYYEWHGQEEGTPVVLVMGLGGDVTAWPLQLAALAPRHRVLVFDNRGAGRSDAPDVAYTTAGMAGDLLALLDGLGVGRAHLLGLSLGGAIAQEAVLGAPERFASLQLHATWAGPHPYFQALVHAVRAAWSHLDREAFYRALCLWLFTPTCYALQPELIDTVVQAATHHPYPTPTHAYLRQTDAALGHDTRERLQSIRCPTLVATGSRDLITPPFLAEELAAKIPGARLAFLPELGHGALWEAPAVFNRLCLDFLDSIR